MKNIESKIIAEFGLEQPPDLLSDSEGISFWFLHPSHCGGAPAQIVEVMFLEDGGPAYNVFAQTERNVEFGSGFDDRK